MNMLETLFGNSTAEKVLLFLQVYDEGYGTQIARTFDISLSQVQKQLERFENGGLLVRRTVGRTILYSWNKRNPLVKSVRNLLKDIVITLPKTEINAYYRQRRRPRRKGKPL